MPARKYLIDYRFAIPRDTWSNDERNMTKPAGKS